MVGDQFRQLLNQQQNINKKVARSEYKFELIDGSSLQDRCGLRTMTFDIGSQCALEGVAIYMLLQQETTLAHEHGLVRNGG